nr:immunoglobulin heavy chain junction region [Mus musculus]
CARTVIYYYGSSYFDYW